MHLVIRADANSRIGNGHVMRCLALAENWKSRGGHVTFLSNCEELRERITEDHPDFIHLEKSHPDPYDLEKTLSILRQRHYVSREYPRTWLVLDGYHFDSHYQHAIRKTGHRLLVIDDTAHLPNYHADLLLNQNYHAGHLPYQTDSDTKFLLGTRYVLLRREFLHFHKKQTMTPDKARRLLVTLGGSDPHNTTLSVIEAIEMVDLFTLDVKIVVGPSNPHLDTLTQQVKRSKHNTQILRSVADMSPLMAWAHMAVSGGGSTCWELAFMGVPSLTVSLAENQLDIARALDQRGVSHFLGPVNEMSIDGTADAISDLIHSRSDRRRMTETGRCLVDGYGTERVVDVISLCSRN